jgi:hypothetical protein
MKKLRMKVRLIKSKIKIIEPGVKKPVKVASQPSGVSASGSLESKTTSSVLPLIKSEKQDKPIVAQAQPRQPGQTASQQPKTDERIFVSYDRFQMSEAEKRKAYTLDIRGNAPSKPTATISPNISRNNEMQTLGQGEALLERGARGHLRSDEHMAGEDIRKYREGLAEDYKPRRRQEAI